MFKSGKVKILAYSFFLSLNIHFVNTIKVSLEIIIKLETHSIFGSNKLINVRIDVENVPLTQKKLVLQFQRKLPELDEEEIQSIFNILKEDK